MQVIIGKFYGFVLLQNEDDGTIQIQHGCSLPYKEKYKNIEEAKEQIRSWKKCSTRK
jgi:hypothetical protein